MKLWFSPGGDQKENPIILRSVSAKHLQLYKHLPFRLLFDLFHSDFEFSFRLNFFMNEKFP